MSAASRRIFGLDVVRAAAIGMVLFGHMMQQSRPPYWLKSAGSLGILGVEIFFVLSGFLIGGILIKLLKEDRFRTREDLFLFWSRRWLRTLPLYYIYFFIYLRYDWTGPSHFNDRLEYLAFLQSFAWQGPAFFTLAWSLAIEEYFYLLFPLMLWFLNRRLASPARAMLVSICTFLTVPLLLKAVQRPYFIWGDFDAYIRMMTVTRLDSLMYGVGAAWIKSESPVLWRRIRAAIPWAACLNIGVVLFLYLDVPGLMGSHVLQTLIFPVISLSVALTLPYFDGLHDTRGWWKPPVAWISTLSYSIYLGHILVLTLVNDFLKSAGLWDSVYVHPWKLYPIYLMLICILTPVTYFGWEQPFMRLRDFLPKDRKRLNQGLKGPPSSRRMSVVRASNPRRSRKTRPVVRVR